MDLAHQLNELNRLLSLPDQSEAAHLNDTLGQLVVTLNQDTCVVSAADFAQLSFPMRRAALLAFACAVKEALADELALVAFRN